MTEQLTVLVEQSLTQLTTAEQMRSAALSRIEMTAQAMVVRDKEDASQAAAFIAEAKRIASGFEEERTSLKKPVLEAGRRIDGVYNPITTRIKAAVQTVSNKVFAWQKQERERAAEEQRKAEEKAAKEREKLQKRAAAAAEKGQEEKSERLWEKAELVQAAPVAAGDTKVRGLASREVWRAELEDWTLLLGAAMDGNPLARSFLMFNQDAANKQARATKDSLKVPGVRFVSETVGVSR